MASSFSTLLHPVRLRITQSLLGHADPGLTTAQLHELMPEVAIATLYRHVAHLVEHAVIEVADAHQVRGASEKLYRIAPGLTNPTPDELRSAEPDDLLTAFTVFTSGLIHDFDAYIHGDTPDLDRDRVSFAQADFWATTGEIDAFLATMMTGLQSLMANAPSGERRQRKLTTVLVPRPATDGTRA